MIQEDKSDVSACALMRFSDEQMLKNVLDDGTDVHICLERHDIWRNIVENECSAEGFIANKMFRRSAIKEIRFDETLRMSEDQLFVFQVLSKVELISVCGNKLYYYRQSSSSTTANLDISGWNQSIYVARKLLPIVSEDETIVPQYENYIAERYYEKALGLMKTNNNINYSEIKETRKEYLKFRNKSATNTKKEWKRCVGQYLFSKHEVLFILYKAAYNVMRKVKRTLHKQ